MQKPYVKTGIKYACLGEGTASELRKHVSGIGFIGSSPDTVETGKAFAKMAAYDSVLFPGAKKSLRTIQQQMPDAQKVYELDVYETIFMEVKEIPDYDVMVFTSPSSVLSFLKYHSFDKSKHYIAIGKSTGQSLKEAGAINIKLSEGFADEDLANAVLSL